MDMDVDMDMDLSVYLVTDPKLLPHGVTFLEQVEKAIRAGVTIVQLREKHKSTEEFIGIAHKVHELTKKFNVPLIINDRVDVALAVDAEGVHVGQDDLDPHAVRQKIGRGKILGLSVGSLQEAEQAAKLIDDIDYVGIGAIYSTATKADAESIGTEGVSAILDVLPKELRTVGIGGISSRNSKHVMAKCRGPKSGKTLDGVAVVSAIMREEDVVPEVSLLTESVDGNRVPCLKLDNIFSSNPDMLYRPFVHHITNNVVKNFSANATIAVGGSPAMSECAAEFAEFSEFPNSVLLLNMGTASEAMVPVLTNAMLTYRMKGGVVFDPVAAGASEFRRALGAKLMKLRPRVVKGNADEIVALAGRSESAMRGVDSTGSYDETELVETAAKLNTGVIVITGKVDYVVEVLGVARSGLPKYRFCRFSGGGHKYLPEITGSGCTLGSIIACAIAGHDDDDTYERTKLAVAYYRAAAKRAGSQPEVKGPGSFNVAFLDALHNLRHEAYIEAECQTFYSFEILL